MTMAVPLQGCSCPPWQVDGPETREGAFRDSVRAAYIALDVSARRKMVDSAACRNWHRQMFKSHVPLDYYAGNYRQIDVQRPCLDVNVEVAGIRGFPPGRVIFEMEQLFTDLPRQLARLETSWPQCSPQDRAKRLATILGILIGRFIQVHPFVNGNGRTSRLLWAWGLIRFGVPPQVRVRNHPENPTYDQIMGYAMDGDFRHLALFILQHLAAKPPGIISPAPTRPP